MGAGAGGKVGRTAIIRLNSFSLRLGCVVRGFPNDGRSGGSLRRPDDAPFPRNVMNRLPALEAEARGGCAVEEVAGYFGMLASAMGLPRTVGRIYGVLFLSQDAMTFAEVVKAAGISKASTSTGLRILTGLRAVHAVSNGGERRMRFAAETSAKRLVRGLLAGTMLPQLEAGEELLARVADDDPFVSGRLERLRSWHRGARELLPKIGRYGIP